MLWIYFFFNFQWGSAKHWVPLPRMTLSLHSHKNKTNCELYIPFLNSKWMHAGGRCPIPIQTQIKTNVYLFCVDIWLCLMYSCFFSLSTEDWDSGWRDGAVKDGFRMQDETDTEFISQCFCPSPVANARAHNRVDLYSCSSDRSQWHQHKGACNSFIHTHFLICQPHIWTLPSKGCVYFSVLICWSSLPFFLPQLRMILSRL